MKLHQLIALVGGRKTETQQYLTAVHRGWTADRITGISRVYGPKDEDGEVFPPEKRHVQLHAPDALAGVAARLADFYDLVARQEDANTRARADVVVDGKPILKNVPVGLLLFLEKQLVDLLTLARNIPTLPSDRIWRFDSAKGCHVTEPEQTVKTQKKSEVIVKYEATPEHPAQTELVQVDKTIGHWTTVHMSGALPESERTELITRLTKLRDAVKCARQLANETESRPDAVIGSAIFEYVLQVKSQ